MKYETERDIKIQVNVVDYKPCRKLQYNPDDPEEVEITAFMIVKNGSRVFKIELSHLEIEALDLESEAIDKIKHDRISTRVDKILDERPVPDKLINKLKDSIQDIQKLYMEGYHAGMEGK